MDFIDQVKLLSARIEKTKDLVKTEEATKTSLIMPFFQLLGYDVFNPIEFIPEFNADVGIKKGEKVDYAIMLDEKPVILVEAKSCGENLDRHGSQLFRYFSTTESKFCILTNGVEYRFYTDLDEVNKMDDEPFFKINILDLKDQEVAELKKFHKSTFDVTNVFTTAEDLKYTSQIKQLLLSTLESPSDDFTNYVASEIYQGRKTKLIIDKFRPVVKKAFNEFVSDLMNDKIKAIINPPTQQSAATIGVENNLDLAVTSIPTSNITTTQEELEGLGIIKAILKDTIPIEKIFHKDTESYFGVLYENNTRKWICRLKVETSKKYLILPDSNKNQVQYPISSVNNLFEYADSIKESAARYL